MSAIKQVRGQIRQIVKEILPEVLTAEIVAEIAKKLEEKVAERLDKIDQQQKDMTSYIIRNSAKPEMKSTI